MAKLDLGLLQMRLGTGLNYTAAIVNFAAAAAIVSGSVAKATNSNSRSIAISNYTINAGTDLALVVIWCGDYPSNGANVLATWNPGTSVSVPLVIRNANAAWGTCAAFLLARRFLSSARRIPMSEQGDASGS